MFDFVFKLQEDSNETQRSSLNVCYFWTSPFNSPSLMCYFVGQKSQKVPVHKMVRTDSQDPAGRLHSYLQVNPASQLQGSSCLTSVRYFICVTYSDDNASQNKYRIQSFTILNC